MNIGAYLISEVSGAITAIFSTIINKNIFPALVAWLSILDNNIKILSNLMNTNFLRHIFPIEVGQRRLLSSFLDEENNTQVNRFYKL